MAWWAQFIFNYPSFEYIIVFVGATVGGEFALFTLGFLISQGVLRTAPVILLSFIGAFLPNVLWFLLGGTRAMGKMSTNRHTNTTFSIITEAVQRVSRGSHLVAFIIIKFLVGTPVLLVMYTSKTALSFRQFLYYQSIATSLSVLVIMPIGYISGKGFFYISSVFENLYASIGFLLLVLVLIVMFQIWLERMFTNKNNKIE